MKKEQSSTCSLFNWIVYQKGRGLERLAYDNIKAKTIYHQLIQVGTKTKDWSLAVNSYLSLARIHETNMRQDSSIKNLRKAEFLIQIH